MDNSISQSQVAYEDGPKEINKKRRATNSEQQFGETDVMEQDNKGYEQKDYPANPSLNRHGEYR